MIIIIPVAIPIYIAFSWMTNAFDAVEYCKLFTILANKSIPAPMVRLLLHIFTGQHIRVLWNGVYSPSYLVKNGVKQGGVISPILFNLY